MCDNSTAELIYNRHDDKKIVISQFLQASGTDEVTYVETSDYSA